MKSIILFLFCFGSCFASNDVLFTPVDITIQLEKQGIQKEVKQSLNIFLTSNMENKLVGSLTIDVEIYKKMSPETIITDCLIAPRLENITLVTGKNKVPVKISFLKDGEYLIKVRFTSSKNISIFDSYWIIVREGKVYGNAYPSRCELLIIELNNVNKNLSKEELIILYKKQIKLRESIKRKNRNK